MEEYLVANSGFLQELAAVSYQFVRSFSGMCEKMNHQLFLPLDEFRQLTPHDRRKLVEENGPILGRFKSAICIQEDNSCPASRIAAAPPPGSSRPSRRSATGCRR
jgi:hypothetical protein